ETVSAKVGPHRRNRRRSAEPSDRNLEQREKQRPHHRRGRKRQRELSDQDQKPDHFPAPIAFSAARTSLECTSGFTFLKTRRTTPWRSMRNVERDAKRKLETSKALQISFLGSASRV